MAGGDAWPFGTASRVATEDVAKHLNTWCSKDSAIRCAAVIAQGGEMVRKNDFDRYLALWGPISELGKAVDDDLFVAGRLRPWWHGGIERDVANKRLEEFGRGDGSVLCRLSSRAGSVAVSYILRGSLVHSLAGRVRGSWTMLQPDGSVLSSEAAMAKSSLEELLTSRGLGETLSQQVPSRELSEAIEACIQSLAPSITEDKPSEPTDAGAYGKFTEDLSRTPSAPYASFDPSKEPTATDTTPTPDIGAYGQF